jgi:hypothetical protein
MVALTALDAEKFLLDKREGPAIQVAVEEDRSARPLKADRSDLETDMIKPIVLPSSLMLSFRKLGILISKVDLRNLGEALTSLEHGRTDALERTGAENGRLRFELARILSQTVTISIASPRLPESRHKMHSNVAYSGWHLRSYLVPKLMLMGGSFCCQKSNRRCCYSRIFELFVYFVSDLDAQCQFRKLRACKHIDLFPDCRLTTIT